MGAIVKKTVRRLMTVGAALALGVTGLGTAQASAATTAPETLSFPGTMTPQEVNRAMDTLAVKSICYKVHVQDYGTLDWVCGGNTAGSVGHNKAIEKVWITMRDNGEFCAQAHIRNVGWQNQDCESAGGYVEVGTVGAALPMEALSVWTRNGGGMLSGQAHVQDHGWLPRTAWGYGSQFGTTGQGKNLEAIRLWV
ncbi:hypothetical protein ACN20G_26575 (plasmid) [Streptomyces sp. BI20]|uniref:hypothetical protein n=1 Tax=Streptomyces sp. BI20 TaxID=3403460 RepID=UPI003C761D32